MKKSLIALLLASLLVFLTSFAHAENITPRAGTGHRVIPTLSLSGSESTGSARISLLEGYSATMTVYVQRLDGGTWKEVISDSGTPSCTVTFNAQHGYSYRVYAVCTIMSSTTNTVVDRITSYSAVKSY